MYKPCPAGGWQLVALNSRHASACFALKMLFGFFGTVSQAQLVLACSCNECQLGGPVPALDRRTFNSCKDNETWDRMLQLSRGREQHMCIGSSIDEYILCTGNVQSNG
jgi:hypothetical protein